MKYFVILTREKKVFVDGNSLKRRNFEKWAKRVMS